MNVFGNGYIILMEKWYKHMRGGGITHPWVSKLDTPPRQIEFLTPVFDKLASYCPYMYPDIAG